MTSARWYAAFAIAGALLVLTVLTVAPVRAGVPEPPPVFAATLSPTGLVYVFVTTNEFDEVFTDEVLVVTHVVIQWPSTAGRIYDLLKATNVLGAYNLIVGGIVATPPYNSYTDAVENIPLALYRLRVGF